jgi:polyphosphate glucokinase
MSDASKRPPTPRSAGVKSPSGRSATPRSTSARSSATRQPADPAPAAGTPASAPAPARRTAAAKQPAAKHPVPVVPKLVRPVTLAFDIGGTGLKGSVLDAGGKMLADRVRVATKYPCPPTAMLDALAGIAAPLPGFDRISAGFPGVVRGGKVLTAPHFVTKKGPGSPVDPDLLAAWNGFPLAQELEARLGKPTRIANDADLQGLEVVKGRGVEMVVTLGTGLGSALLVDGKLAPHLELAHHPFRKGETYNEQIGGAALEHVGASKWRRRVREAIANFRSLVNFDHLYIGGGNSGIMAGHIADDVTIVDNVAGILGGIKLWEDAG